MKLGIAVTDFSWPVPPAQIGPIVSGIARRADEAGFDSLWTIDHFFHIRITGLLRLLGGGLPRKHFPS